MTGVSAEISRLFPDLGQRTHVVGVLNLTPDSFSDGGRFQDPERAVAHAVAMIRDGADLVDVGGDSTRPGSEGVSAEVELERVLPVIRALHALHIPMSIDTTKALVALRALEAGAAVVNDISGGRFDPEILSVVAATQAPMILMHTRGVPKEMNRGSWIYEGGVVEAVTRSLAASIERAVGAGIAEDRLIVDPGIGFGKTVAENVDLLAGLGGLKRLGRPILVGTSRKSFLGHLTGREVGEREFATAASVALSIAAGADFVRVHEVRNMVDVARVADALT
ncbi:MAG: dihydropteroate synthase [Myxococcota bacterium]